MANLLLLQGLAKKTLASLTIELFAQQPESKPLLILFLVVIFLLILLFFGDLSWPFCRRSCLPFNRRLTGQWHDRASGKPHSDGHRLGS